MTDNIDRVAINRLELDNDKVKLRDITLEDLELNLFGKILKVDKVEIDEIELDKNNI